MADEPQSGENAETPSTPLEDDRPRPVESDESPEMRAPLAPFAGEKPPAPEWFGAALAQAPERSFVESRGTKLEVLTWGEVGKPGLLFIHGSSAHADWWSFIAPFFATDYRVAAFSLAGMGLSDWRERYGYDANIADAEAVARATGLYESGGKPIYIGHSFGGAIAYYAASNAPEQMAAAVIVDTGLRSSRAPPGRRPMRERMANLAQEREARVYPTLVAALARFRFTPAQPVENAYIADYIARLSLRPAPMADGSGEGFTWRFDPNVWTRFDSDLSSRMQEDLSKLRVPVMQIIGDRSGITADRENSVLRDLPTVVVPQAYHHVMIDQPLALVATLRAALTLWPA